MRDAVDLAFVEARAHDAVAALVEAAVRIPAVRTVRLWNPNPDAQRVRRKPFVLAAEQSATRLAVNAAALPVHAPLRQNELDRHGIRVERIALVAVESEVDIRLPLAVIEVFPDNAAPERQRVAVPLPVAGEVAHERPTAVAHTEVWTIPNSVLALLRVPVPRQFSPEDEHGPLSVQSEIIQAFDLHALRPKAAVGSRREDETARPAFAADRQRTVDRRRVVIVRRREPVVRRTDNSARRRTRQFDFEFGASRRLRRQRGANRQQGRRTEKCFPRHLENSFIAAPYRMTMSMPAYSLNDSPETCRPVHSACVSDEE